MDVGAEDELAQGDVAELVDQLAVARAVDDLLVGAERERVRGRGADRQADALGAADHRLAQVASSRPASATLSQGLVAISSTAWISSGFTWPSSSLGTVGEQVLDPLREIQALGVEEHQLLLDPDRERGPGELVLEHPGPAYTQPHSARATSQSRADGSQRRTEQKSLLATLAPGKRARLRRLLFEFGPGNGTLLLLPIDQGIEHGPRDFFPNPASKDPEYQFQLAAEAGYSAIACQIGLAEKYYPDYAGQVPLLLKVNGKTDVPPSDEALSTTNASVEDAVRLSAPTRSATRSTSARRARTPTCISSRACARTATATACRW